MDIERRLGKTVGAAFGAYLGVVAFWGFGGSREVLQRRDKDLSVQVVSCQVGAKIVRMSNISLTKESSVLAPTCGDFVLSYDEKGINWKASLDRARELASKKTVNNGALVGLGTLGFIGGATGAIVGDVAALNYVWRKQEDDETTNQLVGQQAS